MNKYQRPNVDESKFISNPLVGIDFKILINKITDGKHRWGMSMALSSVGKLAKEPRKKNREAVGFFGNWAKHHEEKETFEVDDVGC